MRQNAFGGAYKNELMIMSMAIITGILLVSPSQKNGYRGVLVAMTPAEVRAEALASITPKEYPIPVNKRIQKYKAKYAA